MKDGKCIDFNECGGWSTDHGCYGMAKCVNLEGKDFINLK